MTRMNELTVVNQSQMHSSPLSGHRRATKWVQSFFSLLLTLLMMIPVSAEAQSYNEDEDISGSSSSHSSRSERRSRSRDQDETYIPSNSYNRPAYDADWDGRDYERSRSRGPGRRRTEPASPSSTSSGSSTATEAQIIKGDARPANQPNAGQSNQPLVPGMGAPVPGGQVNVAPPAIRGNHGNRGVMQGQQPNPQGQPATAPPVKRGYPTFYFEPWEPHVKEGEEFTVRLMLANEQETAFDFLAAAVKYDLESLEVIDAKPDLGVNIEDATNEAFLLNRQTNYINWVDTRQGIIFYSAPVQGEPNKGAGPFALVKFKALAPTRTPVKLEYLFSRTEDKSSDLARPMTALTLEKKDVLGMAAGQGGGALSASVRIVALGEEIRETLIDTTEYADSNNDGKPYPTWLLLVPDRREVAVGEEFNIDVLLYNPASTPVSFDRISLLLKYDPRKMELTSYDRLVRGTESTRLRINSDLKFDQMERNFVDGRRGIVDFRARSSKNAMTGSGRVLTLSFKALKPVEDARLLVGFSRRDNAPTTGLFERKQDRLGNPKVASDSVFTTGVKVTAPGGA